MNILIEAAQIEDIPKIIKIMKAVNMHHVPSAEMPELDWKCFFIARVDGNIVGAAGYRIISPTEAKTTLMTVLPRVQKLRARKIFAGKTHARIVQKGNKNINYQC